MSYITPDNPVIQALRAEIDQQNAKIESLRADMDALAESCEEAFRLMAQGSAVGLRAIDKRTTNLEVYLGLRAPEGEAGAGGGEATSEGSTPDGAPRDDGSGAGPG